MRPGLIFSALRPVLTPLIAFARQTKQLSSTLTSPIRWVGGLIAGALTTFLALWSFSLAVAQPSVRDILVGTTYDRTRVSIGVDQTVA